MLLIVLLWLSLSSAVQAQQTSEVNRPSLTIKGKGELRVTPDLAVVNMTVKATDADVNGSVKKLNTQTDKLQQKLENAGFARSEMKVSQLSVQENGKWRNGEYIDSGYVAMQVIELRFPRETQRIARLLESFSEEEGAEALFRFGFALSDEAEQEAKEELIRKAILDARSKATVIAKTSGVKLGRIRSITYGQPFVQPVPMQEAMAYEMRMESEASKQGVANMEVREIEMQDTITIHWDME